MVASEDRIAPSKDRSTAEAAGVGDAASRLLSGESPTRATERLDLSPEFSDLTIPVNGVARLAGIVVTLYEDMLRQKKSAYQQGDGYVTLFLTEKVSEEFSYLINHLMEMSDTANQAALKFEEFLVDFRVIREERTRP